MIEEEPQVATEGNSIKKHYNLPSKAKIASIFNEANESRQRRSYTSFGKLILAVETSKPSYSFGSANRFSMSNGFAKTSQQFPGPTYDPTNTEVYKYQTSQKWKMGKAPRPYLSRERYEHYNHQYNEEDDLSKLPKKWNRTVGGGIGLQSKITLDIREKVPGPGRYDPSFVTKPKTPSYYIADKCKHSALRLLTGTNTEVGPGKYDLDNDKKQSIYKSQPNWGIGKANRPPIYNKSWAKNETYETYSSCGNQIRTKKRTEARIPIGKATRKAENQRGMFKSMMDRQPVRVSIAMPSF